MARESILLLIVQLALAYTTDEQTPDRLAALILHPRTRHQRNREPLKLPPTAACFTLLVPT
jgi:hypothetical protein